MPRVDFRLEEQFSDLRSNEVAYKFIIENLGSSAIELLAITPRIPEDVTLLEIRDPSSVALKAKHDELCKELNEILDNYLIISFQEVRTLRVKAEKEMFDEMVDYSSSKFGMVFRLYAKVFSGTYFRMMERNQKRRAAYKNEIESLTQAKAAHDRWLANAQSTDSLIKNLFESKMQRLEELESEMGADLESSSLATIEPESFFAQTYVLRFRRSKWDPKKFNISIEGVYSEIGKEGRHVGGASTSLIISPKPLALTIVAVISSFLGVLLKHALDASTKGVIIPWSKENIQKAFQSPEAAAVGLQTLSGAILALIFFNVYEFTDIGKKIGIGVGWRSALLIGALCGLLGDRILAALKALIGA